MTPVDARLRAANPVPDPQAAMDDVTYHAVLARAEQHRDSSRWGRGQDHRRQQWYFAAATLVAALTLGGILTWLGTRPNGLVAAASPEMEVAEAYIEARNAGDVDTALALLAPNAAVEEYPVIRDLTELPAAFTFIGFVEQKLADASCQSPSPGSVTCTYAMTDRLIEKGRAGPVPGELRLMVEGGQIVAVENAVDKERYQRAADGWVFWLDQNYDGGPDTLYRWTFQLGRIIYSPRLDKLEELSDAIDQYDGSN